MPKSLSLAPISEAALPAHLVEAAKLFMAESRALRTRKAYSRAWALFDGWCQQHGRQSMPASPETVAVWMTALATGDDGGVPRSRGTINQYLSAVIVAHRTKKEFLDRKDPLITEAWKGISNVKAETEVDRAARPLVVADLRELLRGLRLDIPADARDAALLSLGWAGALRRSELVGLDWQKMGGPATNGRTGWIEVDDRGIVVKLAKSKSSQDKAVKIVIADRMPTTAAALQAWADHAKLEPGQPVFRPVDQRGVIGGTKGRKGKAGQPAKLGQPATLEKPGLARLCDHSVALIVKSRVRALLMLRGKSRAEADELVERFSGHSLRAGYVTSGAGLDMPSYRMQQHTRHKSAAMIEAYVREADKWSKNGLDGLGF